MYLIVTVSFGFAFTTVTIGGRRIGQRTTPPTLGPMQPTRAQAEATILDLLARRDPGKTICPSDAARALGGDAGFRPLMPLVRDAARALVAAQRIEVTQSGRPVDLDAARGAIRLRALPPGT